MKKLEELIHNSENHQGINSATVTVHFILAEDTVYYYYFFINYKHIYIFIILG